MVEISRQVGRVGLPATGAAETTEFLRRAFDPQTGDLLVERRGRIWEAVQTAHALGAKGAGRCLAIADIQFDPALLPADRRHPASSPPAAAVAPESARHGTIVALLVHAVAPEATLLLRDVNDGADHFHDLKTAAALRTAGAQGAVAINISGEFESDCAPRDTWWLESSAVDPDPEQFAAGLTAWLEASEPYQGARCVQECAVCDAAVAVGDQVAVFAAAGNIYDRACPACVTAAVGVGFRRSVREEASGNVTVQYGSSQTRHANLQRPELFLEEPPGFVGTSFASPLVTGLAALAPRPQDLAEMAALAREVWPLLDLALQHRAAAPAIPQRAMNTLLEGMGQFARRIPAAHQHWLHREETRPCAVCALLLADWYDAMVSLYILYAGAGWDASAHHALRWGQVAATIAPFSASSAANLGLAWELQSQPLEGAERAAALHAADAELSRARTLAPDSEVYAHLQARVRALIS